MKRRASFITGNKATRKITSIENISLVIAFAALGTLLLNSAPTPAFAAALNDSRGDAANPDFDIRGAGIDDSGNPYIRVSGDAGGTTSDTEGIILGYVFVTDAGIYAVTSHGGIEDSTEVGDDEQYHAHLVTLDANGCVTSIAEDGKAALHNKRVTLTDTDATEVIAVQTVELTASDDGICVTEVFDTA
jgi:hypothetical protein